MPTAILALAMLFVTSQAGDDPGPVRTFCQAPMTAGEFVDHQSFDGSTELKHSMFFKANMGWLTGTATADGDLVKYRFPCSGPVDFRIATQVLDDGISGEQPQIDVWLITSEVQYPGHVTFHCVDFFSGERPFAQLPELRGSIDFLCDESGGFDEAMKAIANRSPRAAPFMLIRFRSARVDFIGVTFTCPVESPVCIR